MDQKVRRVVDHAVPATLRKEGLVRRPLDQVLAALPEKAFIANVGGRVATAASVIAVARGEAGYWTIDHRLTADELNDEFHVTPEQREAMFFGSVVGWDSPGADPANYVREIAASSQNEKAQSISGAGNCDTV